MRSLLSSETPGAAQGTQGSGGGGGTGCLSPLCAGVTVQMVSIYKNTRQRGAARRNSRLERRGWGPAPVQCTPEGRSRRERGRGGAATSRAGFSGGVARGPLCKAGPPRFRGAPLQAQEPLTEMTLPSGHLKRGLGTGTRTNVATWGPFSTPPPVPHKHLCKRNETSR